jgi:hypothetical protein
MNQPLPTDNDALMEEIERYLAAVEVFRSCSCEPTWRPEPPAQAAAPVHADVLVLYARSAH